MKKISRQDYEAFAWIPMRRWSIETLMGPKLRGDIFCKLCDEYVIMSEAQSHIEKHVSQRKRQIADDKRKAKELKLERLRLAREMRALENNLKG